MRLLVTGHRGQVGSVVAPALAAAGEDVVGFDLSDGDDVLDSGAVRAAMAGCDGVVHLAALAHDTAGAPESILATNVLGTWHVLLAARAHGVRRVVYFSSMQVFGTAEGEQPPAYLPIDDDHPRNARRPYGLSKRLAEDLCEAFTADTGIPTICLRPVAVWGPTGYEQAARRRAERPESEWEPFWEFGAFVDIRDVAAAVIAALHCPDPGHARLTLCAADISASAPSREMARRLLPDVPWRGGPDRAEDPYRALVDSSRAARVLDWQPTHRWSDRPVAI